MCKNGWLVVVDSLYNQQQGSYRVTNGHTKQSPHHCLCFLLKIYGVATGCRRISTDEISDRISVSALRRLNFSSSIGCSAVTLRMSIMATL